MKKLFLICITQDICVQGVTKNRKIVHFQTLNTFQFCAWWQLCFSQECAAWETIQCLNFFQCVTSQFCVCETVYMFATVEQCFVPSEVIPSLFTHYIMKHLKLFLMPNNTMSLLKRLSCVCCSKRKLELQCSKHTFFSHFIIRQLGSISNWEKSDL
jgi:hypothetical protein